MEAQASYDQAFFSTIKANSKESAEIVIPLIIDLVNPRSVIDIGCGTGTWLSVFKDHNIEDIKGVDGDWVNDELLLIPKACFTPHDLTQELHIEQRFDLAVSLEVAEHLDKQYAKNFVSTLVKLSSVVLFSAAIPFQGGTHHVNEEWPDYWASLFAEHDYLAIDCIREKIWNNENVAWWYAQNVLVFADKRHVLKDSKLQRAFEQTRISQLSLVHPGKYLDTNKHLQLALGGPGLKKLLTMLPGMMMQRLIRRWTVK
jgi:SAM-dependent methyltransferase